jgi:hypothetical protein
MEEAMNLDRIDRRMATEVVGILHPRQTTTGIMTQTWGPEFAAFELKIHLWRFATLPDSRL